MLKRKIWRAPVVAPDTAGQLRILTPDDFRVGIRHSIGIGFAPEMPVLPCVIDIPRARTIYVPDLDPQKVREEPFCYLFARSEAKWILSVPWEAGPINRPQVDCDPIYVFSCGRCGSTLLHRIFNAANIACVSEPDIGAALLSRVYRNHRALRPLLRWATQAYVRDLMSALGDGKGGLIVKLRSQFCSVARPLLNKSRERRSIFMIRQFEPWARSVSQSFRVGPGWLAGEYRRSLECYAYLRENTDCHFLCYEDFVEQPHQTMAALARFLGREIPDEAIDRALSVRSQAGTRLEQVSAAGKARWGAIRDETLRIWKSSGTSAFSDSIIGTLRRSD